MKKGLLVLLIVVVLLLIGCYATDVAEYELKEEVNANVIEKLYTEEHNDVVLLFLPQANGTISAIPRRKTEPAKYEVKVEYNGLELIINDKELFDVVKIGDKVRVYYSNNELEYDKLSYKIIN